MKIILLMILSSLGHVLCANILYIAPLPSPSHHIWNKVLSMGLIKNGHNITMLCHDTEKEATSNFTVITMEGMYNILRAKYKMEDAAERSTLMGIKLIPEYLKFTCEFDLNTKGLETLLNYPKDFQFDLIVFDVTFSQCLYPLIERFNNPPVVGVTAYLLPPVLSNAFGNHLYTSYMPFYNSDFTNKMNTVQRVLNFIYTYAEILVRDYFGTPMEYELAKKRFGDHIRPIEEIERNMTLLLANTDPILNYPMTLPPNIIPVAGLHVKPARVLPEDLKQIVEKAKHGVILFTLGTNIKSSNLKLERRQALLDAFAKLPQIILWKFELDDLEGLPKNVIIRKWMPQNDILGHPNTKLFISHGGALSTQEAMYHGVPLIGLPFFGDQNINVRRMESKGIAEHLDVKKFTADDVYKAITKVLNSDSYRSNMRTISKLYRDQPETALERAIFWVEYVLRHGSAEHLVLAARSMPSYQTANLDVLAAFILGLVLVYSLFMLIFTGCRYIMVMRHHSIKSKSTK